MRVQILRILIRNRNSFLLNGKKKEKKKRRYLNSIDFFVCLFWIYFYKMDFIEKKGNRIIQAY